jgi:Holliday junction resolvase RusA-like endonuclease
MLIEIEIDPVAKPRQTRSDRWKKRPVVLRYRAFADQLRQACLRGKFFPSNELSMEFYLPMPKSWSKKRKIEMLGQPSQGRKDVDNLVKSVLDALFAEDCTVWNISAKKYWAETGSIRLENL